MVAAAATYQPPGALWNRLTQYARSANRGPGLRRSANASEVVRLLAAEIGYTPPPKKGLPARLEHLRPSAGAGESAERHRFLEGRRAELAAQLEETEAELDRLPLGHSGLEHVGRLLSRRESISFLLSRIPEVPPAAPAVDWQAAQREEVGRVRAWRRRLEEALEAMRRRAEGLAREGVVGETDPRFLRLRQEVADVLLAIADADENLKLVR